MKKIFIPIVTLVLVACGSSSTLEELNKKREKIEGEIAGLKKDLDEVNAQIEKLDTTSNNNLTLITIDEVKEMPFSETVRFQGTIEADKNVMVSPQASGTIKAIYVNEGQQVAQGTVLASLDSDILGQNIAEVQKSLELANYMYEKQKSLKEQGVGVEVQLEQAKNQKESLERKLATLNTQASKSRIVSPISGYVDQIIPNIGEMGSPQMPMFRVLNLDKVTIKSEVSENYLTSIKAGSSVSVYFPSLDLTLDNLKVARTGKYINPSNRTFEIQIDVPNTNNRILPNLLAEVVINKQTTNDALVIPSRSVLEDNKGEKYVYTYANGKVKKQSVKVSFVQGELTQIEKENGIEKGDQLVVRGVEEVVDGEEVNVKK